MRDSTVMSSIDWTLLLLLSMLWGGSFFFSKVAVAALPPLTIVFMRFSAGALLVYAYARARSVAIPTDIGSWLSFAGMGLFNNLIPASLIVWGQTTIPSGLASIIIATTPIFSMIAIRLSSADERLNPAKILGMVLGLVGVCVLFQIGTAHAANASSKGIIACLGASAAYGCANALGKRFRRLGIAPVAGAMGQMTTTAIMALPVMLALETPWKLAAPSVAVWASMAGLAVLSTALGYVVFFRILASAGAINISLVTLLIPVTAVVLGSAVLGERISTDRLAGMLLIALGLIAIDGRALAVAGRVAATSRARAAPRN